MSASAIVHCALVHIVLALGSLEAWKTLACLCLAVIHTLAAIVARVCTAFPVEAAARVLAALCPPLTAVVLGSEGALNVALHGSVGERSQLVSHAPLATVLATSGLPHMHHLSVVLEAGLYGGL